MNILIVEDEAKIANLLRRSLLQEYYTVDIARDGNEGLEKTSFNTYDLIILDLMLPRVGGLTVCKKIREENSNIPILVLTAKDDVNDKIALLDGGADDYVIKPFSLEEVSARIRALLRRGNKADPAILSVADLTLNPATKEAIRNNHAISLTAREYMLLEYLMRNQKMVLSRNQLLEHVWDYNYEGLSNIVETYIKYLRKKLQVTYQSKQLIHTVRGLGYILKA